EVLARVSLRPGGGWHPWAYGFVMPLRYAREFRRCAIFRVFQITGALPAVIAKRRFGVPFVTTYGFWYGRLGRSRATGVLRRTVELRLTFVGDGPARASLEAAARRRGVAADFVPVVEHRRVPAYLADSDAFVLPSKTEGHPKALLEAMSAGVPCVASNVIGNRALIEPGTTGLLFDLVDPGALAEALARVLGDPEGARTIADRARARVVERYDLARLVAEEIELLKRHARAA